MSIVKSLNLYRAFTPNLDGGRHFVFSSYESYLQQLSFCLDKTIEANNYRINALTCQINGITDDITYIIDIERDTAQNNAIVYFKCYYVEKITIQSGFTILSLSIDNWGTYFNKVDVQNAVLKRSNRDMGQNGVGAYDNIKETIVTSGAELLDFEALDGDATGYDFLKTYDDEDVSIVFIASLVVAQNLAGTESTTAILPLACTLKYLRELCTQEKQQRYGCVEIATQIISGITALKYQGTSFIVGDVQVLKVFMIPTDALVFTNYGYVFKTKCQCLSTTQETEFTATLLKPSKYMKFFTINVNNMNINIKYYLGVVNDGLELTHFTKNNIVSYTFEVNHDGVNVIVAQGDDFKDITSHFEVALIGSSVSQDALQKIAYFTKSIASNINIASSKTAIGGIESALSFASNLLSNRTKAKGTIGNSDATLIYAWSNVGYNKVITPYYFTKYKSVINEKKNARIYGVNYNISIGDYNLVDLLADLKYAGYLLGENVTGEHAYTFMSIECCVQGAPVEACDTIKNKLARGVYYD